MTELTILGQTIREPLDRLEGFPAPPSVREVILRTSEMTALCPITGQPDYYTLEIHYMPDRLCLESKSLKLYLWTFRNSGTFCESLSEKLAQDIFNAINPHWVEVVLLASPRGGISIESRARVEK